MEDFVKFFLFCPGLVLCFIWSFWSRHMISSPPPGWFVFVIMSSIASLVLSMLTVCLVGTFFHDPVKALTAVSVYVIMCFAGNILWSCKK